MGSSDRCIVLPVETDDYYTVRGLTAERYVRVQAGKNDFFIPANVFRRAAFTLREGERLDEPLISAERLANAANGEKRLVFTVRNRSGERRTGEVAGDTVIEILERIDQVKALLHSYVCEEEEAPLLLDADEDNDDGIASSARALPAPAV